MNRYLFGLGALGLSLLAGCATQPTAPTDARGLAASFAAGRAYDNTQSALRSGDDAGLRQSSAQYARASARIKDGQELGKAVWPIVVAGMRLDRQSNAALLVDRPRLQAQALTKYRAAGAFLPANPTPGSVDADTLNLVGYQLADRGTTRADWERAEQLTRLALAEWDTQLKSVAKDDPKRLQMETERTIGPLDSHAWALFRLGRYKEALKQQEKVLKFARSNSVPLTADVPFHLAEIYRALGRDEDARREYEEALSRNPEPELLLQIDAALNAKVA